jgi:outer membrane protein
MEVLAMLLSPFRIAAVATAITAFSTPVLAQRLPRSFVPAEAQAPPARSSPGSAARRLTLDDAVRLALEQNLGIQIERLDPEIQDVAVAQARASWAPNVSTTLARNAQSQPAESAIVPTSQNGTFATGLALNEILPWAGSYSAAWNNQRQTTTNILTNFSPLLQSTLSVSYTQPLLRNFSIDAIRQQLAISRKVRDLSDLNVRAVVIGTTRTVKDAYWDLVYANDNLDAQRQSLDLAQQSLSDNQRRVALGTMARIDIVQDEAEVANNQQNVIIAEAAIKSAEDRLRVLILDPATSDFWSTALEPSDIAPFEERAIDVDAAIARALRDRTDLQQARNGLQQEDVTLRYDRNQLLPDVSVSVNYGTFGIGGTELSPVDLSLASSVLASSRSIVSQRGYGSVLGDVFGSAYPQWSIGLQVGYQLGTRAAEANLARARLQSKQAQLQLENLEVQAALQVREAARQVETDQKRVRAARASAQLQQQKLEAEQRKLAAGTSTGFFVIQAQRDLAQARTLETQALLDYNKALVDYEAVQEVSLSGSSGGATAIGAGALQAAR